MISRATRHITPLRALTTRHSISACPPIPSQQFRRTWARFSSSSPQEQSLNSQFFKTFGRPILKVFLLAIFTYQVAYYCWVRLEQDEIKSEMRATISDLEARIEQLETVRGN